MEQILKINQQSESERFLSFPADQKYIQMTTPQEQLKLKSQLWENEEIFWLLSDSIENKINWEHQKVLLWNEKGNQEMEKFNQDQLDYEAIKSEIILPAQNQTYGAIKNQKQEVRTPQLFNAIEPQSPIKITLQSQSQIKNTENISGCQCKKSKCLKMYCECFRSGNQCKNCNCSDCKNHPGQEMERRKVIKAIKQKQPFAFSNTSRYKGCRCTKSQCSKGYCECYLKNLICGKYCKCVGCSNCNQSSSLKIKKHKKINI